MPDIIKKPSIANEKVKIGFHDSAKKTEDGVDVVHEAQIKAKEILNDARKESEKILNEVSLKSKEIKEKAYSEGYKFGIKQSTEEWNLKISSLQNVIDSLKGEIDKTIDDITPSLLELSIVMIKEIVLSEVKGDVISKKIDRAIDIVKSSKRVVVHLPKTLPKEVIEKIKEESIEIIMDSNFDLDDVKIEADFGVLDLRVNAQLKVFEELLRKNFGI